MSANTPLNESEANAIQRFKVKAREFWDVWEELDGKSDLAESDPRLAKEYNDIMDRGITIRNNIEKVTGAIDAASNAYGKAVDYTSRGIETAVNWFKGTFGLGALNAIPLIPIAVIGVAMAAITKWLKDAYVLNKKLDMVDKLTAKGMDPARAASVADKMISKPSLINLSAGVSLPLIAAAIIGFLYFRKR